MNPRPSIGYDSSMEIGVYGLGRFGAFWAQLLSNKFKVKAYNRSDRPTPDGVERVGLEELCDCSYIFLCTAISSIEEVCLQLAPYLKKAVTLVDTCSVKVAPLASMEKVLPDHVSILGTHPMFGPDSAAQGIKDLPIVLSPVRISPEGRDFWAQSFSEMGLRVLAMTPQEHDREAAYTQGITHFIGRLLNELELQESPMATKGYNALLEIVRQTCNDPWQLFLDLQSYNPYTAEMRTRFEEVLGHMVDQFDAMEPKGDWNG